jgi:hypothetical protein
LRAWLRRWLGVVPPAQDSIIGNFNLTSQLAGGSGRSIQFAGYVYKDETQEQLQYRLDVIRSVIDRERTISEIPELEAKREQMIKGMEQAREILTELETRQQNGGQLSSQERLNVRNMRTNIQKVSEEIEKGTRAIEEAKRKVA